MIQIGNDTFVAADDIKEVSIIRESSSVKIIYEVKQLQEKTIVFDDYYHAKAFQQALWRNINSEQGEKSFLNDRKEFALELLQRLEEHYFLEEK